MSECQERSSNIDLYIFDLDETLVRWANGEPQLFTDVKMILDWIFNTKCKIVLATYNRWAEHYLEKFELTQYFDFVAIDITNTLDRLDYKKEMLKDILKRFDVPPERT